MENLLYKAIQGDKESFIEAINKCTLQLYKMGKTILKNDEDIADVIQDTILTAYEKLNTLKEPKFFNTWVVRIFINKCNALLKKNKTIINIEDISHISSKDKNLRSLELKEAISDLKEDYRTVITLHYIMGFSIKEICSILDEKEGTIKSRLCRARNDLRYFYGINKEVK